MAINIESATRQLRDNRLMKDNEQIRLFEEALEEISAEENVAHIAALCQGFDDNTEHQEVTFGLVHTIEGYDRLSSSKEAISNFIEAASAMLPQAADWLRTMLVRILNDANSRCMVPECDGVTFGRAIQQKLWDRYFTAAPVQHRQYDAVSSVVRKASKR